MPEKEAVQRGGGATKPPMPRLAAVEAAEQAHDLRVRGRGTGVLVFAGGELTGDGGCRRRG
jgi:hypothetical protein